MKTNSTALGARMLALAGLTGVLAAPVWAQGTSSQGSGAQSSATAETVRDPGDVSFLSNDWIGHPSGVYAGRRSCVSE